MDRFFKRITATVCAAVCLLGGTGLTNSNSFSLCSDLSISAEAADGDWTYHKGSDSQGYFAIIDSYVGTSTSVYTPTKLGGYPVKMINSFGSKRKSTLKTVFISAGVTRILDYAFQNFTALTSVNLPNSVDQLGNYAFNNCTSLKSVCFTSYTSSVLNQIGTGCFRGCGALQSIELPYAMRTLGGYAFSNCTSMTSAKIHTGLIAINGGAFNNCYSLRNAISFPATLQNISNSAFENCTSLPSVSFGTNTSLGLYIYGDAFKGCSSLKTVTIGKRKVTQISDGSFENCTSLTRINFPTVSVAASTGTYTTEQKDNIIFERNALKNCPSLSGQFYTDHKVTLPSFNRGSGKILSGEQNLVLVFLDVNLDIYRASGNQQIYQNTISTSWTEAEKAKVRKYAADACTRLTGWTNSHGVYGRIKLNGEIDNIGGNNTLTIDIKNSMANSCSATNSSQSYSYYYLKEQIYNKYGKTVPQNTVFLACINYAAGRSATVCATSDTGWSAIDAGFVMTNVNSSYWTDVICHETLHLYGTPDLYMYDSTLVSGKDPVKQENSRRYSYAANSNDVMLSSTGLSLNNTTANMLGWTDVYFKSDFAAYQEYNRNNLIAVQCND